MPANPASQELSTEVSHPSLLEVIAVATSTLMLAVRFVCQLDADHLLSADLVLNCFFPVGFASVFDD